MTTKQILPIVAVLALCCSTMALDHPDSDSDAAKDEKLFLAGAAQVDITPPDLPVIVSGSFLERTADTVRDRLYARALVFDDGTFRVVICVVDILFMPRDLLDEAKYLVAKQTDIRVEDILVSTTHTQPVASLGCNGAVQKMGTSCMADTHLTQRVEWALVAVGPGLWQYIR